MSAIVLTPAYSHAHHLLLAAIARAGLPWLPLYGHSDLVRARSILISQGVARADVLVLVDADIVPDEGVLAAAAAAATPERAVFGVYPQRDGERLSIEPEDEGAARAAFARREPFPIVFGGLGLAAIHRESLGRLDLPIVTSDHVQWRPYCCPFVREGVYHGDDRSLCARLRDVGVELVADPRLSVRHAITELRSVVAGMRGDRVVPAEVAVSTLGEAT
jgi:hypothetical protein